MPKRKRLTDAVIKQTKRPKEGRVELSDGIVPGLRFRISSTGAQSFVLSYRRDGKQTRQVVGRYPRTSLSEARRLASEIVEGQSPAQVLGLPDDDDEGPLTFAALYQMFVHRGQVHRTGPRAGQPHANADRARRLIERYVLPKWRDRLVADISKRDAARLLAEVAEHSPSTAIYLHSSLASLFSWGVKFDEIPTSPLWKLPLPAARVERDRILSDEELAATWKAAEALGTPWRQWVRLLILTGCRRTEIAGLRWSEIDFAGRCIKLPAERTKSARARTVHLSVLAMAEIESLPENGGVYAVSCTRGTKPVTGFGKIKQTMDQASGVTAWRWHDIRRTFRSGLAALGIPPAIAERVVNHSAGSAILRIYDRHSYGEEMAVALDRWSAHIRDLVEPPAANVRKLHVRANRREGRAVARRY